MTAPTLTRLHVTPLDHDLLPAVLGSRLVKVAQNISFHQIQTFPESNYGYLELPSADAQALQKKLHNAILRGKKMKIEEARPKKRRHEEVEQAEPKSKSRKKSKDEKTNTAPDARFMVNVSDEELYSRVARTRSSVR